MEIIKHTKPRLLIADENKHIRDVNDVYRKEYIDEAGNIIEEHKPYYSTVIFLADQIQTLEEAKKLFVEEEMEV